MPYVKRIVCLANSYKKRGRCIAGKEVLAKGVYGGWIRPVSDRPKDEISLSECRYPNGAVPEPLDVIDVQLLHPAPKSHQTENHVVDPRVRWVKRGEFPWQELEKLQDHPRSLWRNRYATCDGRYDCLSQPEASTCTNSLYLIKRGPFIVEVSSKIWDGVKTKTYRGLFQYNSIDYNFSITNPLIRNIFAGRNEGQYELPDAYLCVSLTEPFEKDGRCYKLVAAVLTRRKQ